MGLRRHLLLFAFMAASACGSTAAEFLVDVGTEAAGANCQFGGARIDSGPDTNGNGTLDAEEIEATEYVCDGSDGVLVVTSAEPAGSNCARGGTRIDYGIDDNGDGTLDPAEIDGTEYQCNTAEHGGMIFEFSGAAESWEVPTGVASLRIEAIGAGGANNEDMNGSLRNNGGRGALMSADFTVTPGETFTIAVGGTGIPGDYVSGGTGGGAGGGSGVLRGTTALVIAGGGGGAGYQTVGSDAVTTANGTAGFGSSGGAGGIGGANGSDNTFNASSAGGRGWNNGVPTPGDPKSHAGGWGLGGGGGGATSDGHGGGGGGGYSGGGGGWDGGGGGGGSYNSGTNRIDLAGAGVADGVVYIYW